MSLLILKEFVIAFLMAAVLGAVFALVTRRKGRQTGFFWFFLIVFITTWAGGIWIQPLAVISKEIKWWPFIIVGLPFALLLAAFGQRTLPERRLKTLDKLDEMTSGKALEELTYAILKGSFWFVLAIMFIAILFRYATRI